MSNSRETLADIVVSAPAPAGRPFWSQSGLLLLTQALVQGVNLGSNVLAVGILPAREVGLISLQTAISAWLYFTHAGTLNHLFNELPRLGASAQVEHREAMLRGALGVLLAVSLPLTLLGCLPFAAIFGHELRGGGLLLEFFGTTVLAVVGAQWTQAKECDIKSRGEPTALARWNILLTLTSALPLLLLCVAPAYHVFIWRAPLGQVVVAFLTLVRDERTFFRPLLRDVVSYLRGGFHLVICQALTVLILQGERLFVAHSQGVTAVGEMQLYFLLQTGVQLVPATATNLWFPRARQEPTSEVLCASLVKALRFSFVALVGTAVIGGAIGFALRQGWGGDAFRVAAPGLLLGCIVAPAHAWGSLLFVFMAKDRVPQFVAVQLSVMIAQAVLYLLHPTSWSLTTLVLVRAGMLYLALCACVYLALRVARHPRI